MRIIDSLETEKENANSVSLDKMNALEIVTLMNHEDESVAHAVRQALPAIAKAVEAISGALAQGGRLIYIGAGTSGRLGVLDAAECPPTYSTEPGMIQGILAGGDTAIFDAIEGAEDDQEAGAADLQNIQLTRSDVVVGISASGRTPYIVGALTFAKKIGAIAISIACNQQAKISQFADVAIEVATGPEVVGGSTRLKAGTAQKMILNMLSTASMVRLGKVYENLMIDVKPTNEKLVDRSCSILMKAAEVSYEESSQALTNAGHQVKVALIMLKTGLSKDEAESRLQAVGGFVRKVLDGEGEL